MNSRVSALTFVVGSLLLALLVAAPVLGRGPNESSSQTWPSRTPTSSGPSQPPGTEPPPGPPSLSTPQPGSTAAPTLAATVDSSAGAIPNASVPAPSGTGAPSSGAERPVQPWPDSIEIPSSATVGDCGLPPMAVAFGTVNVRSGPGIEFESIAELEFQFERPIVGRAATAAWWQILLSAGQLGWVSDLGITVIGYTGAVPITATGANDGQQPEWNPTPNPLCTPPSQEEIVISDGQLEALRLAESATPASDDVQPRKPSPAAANNDQQSSALSPQLDDNATEFNLIWLLVAGGILIATGSIALLLQRRQA